MKLTSKPAPVRVLKKISWDEFAIIFKEWADYLVNPHGAAQFSKTFKEWGEAAILASEVLDEGNSSKFIILDDGPKNN